MLSKVALLSACMMAFTYVGYPLIACVAAAAVRRRRHSDPEPRKVSVILAVHNEGHRLSSKVRNLLAQDYPRKLVRVIVVDDGSSDGSVENLESQDLERVTIISLPERRGKAAALNAGLGAAMGDVVVFTDARQAVRPDAIRMLCRNFSDPSVAAVTGRLFSPAGSAGRLFRRYVEAVRSWEGIWGSCAGAAGALWAVRRECVEALPEDTILDDLVLSLSATAVGRLVYEKHALAFESHEDSARVWRRRLRTLAGNWQILFHPVKYRRVFTTRSFVPLVCQKLLRLLFPFAALAFAVSVLAVWPVVIGPAAVLILALVLSAGLTGALRGSVISALSSLLFAPLEALWLYLSGRQTVLWARSDAR